MTTSLTEMNFDHEKSFDKESFLGRLDNNMMIYKKLLSIATDINGHLEGLKTSIESHDKESIRRSAHKLKGASVNLSFNRLSKMAAAIEYDPVKDPDTVGVIFDNMLKEWGELKGIVQSELNN